jgi:hypothetical protein
MNPKPNNPPAFPFSCEAWTDHTGANINTGMTLRDYFAAKWLQGLAASPDFACKTIEQTASCCYKVADAMLAKREEF